MTGLREFLIEKAAAIRGLAASKPHGAQWHETVAATCVSDDRTGVRKLRIRDWQFIGDSGPGFGGFSLGPSSPELLCGVISTCLTHTYQIGACMQGVPVDRIEVNVTCENNDARFGGVETDDPPVPFTFEAVVTLDARDATGEQLSALHRWASESCPLTNLIRRGAPVAVRVA
ncbi:MAG: OsmC family protein [Dehalococcoidia bacterium]